MATTFPRYNHLISKTLDPLFALSIGIAAAGIRIRREETEKRFGQDTSSLVKARDGSRIEGEGEVGFGEIAKVGWGRVVRAVKGGEVGG